MAEEINIVKKILAGEPAGLNALLARHGHELAEYVRAFTLSDDALFSQVYEDVLVDVLRQVRMATEKKNGRLRLFIFQSAARTLRKRHAKLIRSEGLSRSPEASLGDLADTPEPKLEDLQKALHQLPPEERELLILRYRFGFSYGEISDITREARVQFEDRLLRARAHFRAFLAGATAKA